VAVTFSQPWKKLDEYMEAKPWSDISLMSAPAAKAFSDPVSTAQALALVGVERRERVDQLSEHPAVERVQRLRAG
jgi:hypothetical protein